MHRTGTTDRETLAILLLVCSLAAGCGRTEQAPGEPEATPAPAAAGFALAPVLGGVVQAVGNYVVELAVRPDGEIVAQVRDEAMQPVAAEAISVSAEVDDGEAAVPVLLVREGDLYVGRAAGVEGPRPVSVIVEPADAPELEVVFPSVTLVAPSVEIAAPLHGGQVTVVGDNRVEVATAPDGEVYVSVTDLGGVPVAPEHVALEHVTIVTPTGPRVVALQPRGAVFVGTLGVPPPPTFSVGFDLGVRGYWYPGVRFRRFRPLPPTSVVVVPPVFYAPGPGWVGYGVPVVPLRAHPGRGWAKGHYSKGPPPGHGWAKGHGSWGPPGHAGKGPPPGHAGKGPPPGQAKGPGGRGGPPGPGGVGAPPAHRPSGPPGPPRSSVKVGGGGRGGPPGGVRGGGGDRGRGGGGGGGGGRGGGGRGKGR